MKSGLKVRADKSRDVLAALREIGRRDVLVGIPGEASEREDAPFGNAGIGYINENGSPAQNIPPRPHLQPGVRSVQDETTAQLKLAALAVLDGKSGRAEQYLARAGVIAANAVKRYIIIGNLTPLAPSTLYARKHRKVAPRNGENPLIDTGEYRRTITYVVRDKNAIS